VLVYLRDGTSGVPTTALSEESTASELERSRQWKDIGLGAQILRDLRISSIRLFATRSRTYVGLAGFGIEIDATEPLEEPSTLRLIVKEMRPPRRAANS
jgi:3,4-dihydroxy 2-butanone 4-phosphate synthase/GTP cyclohydrolase II